MHQMTALHVCWKKLHLKEVGLTGHELVPIQSAAHARRHHASLHVRVPAACQSLARLRCTRVPLLTFAHDAPIKVPTAGAKRSSDQSCSSAQTLQLDAVPMKPQQHSTSMYVRRARAAAASSWAASTAADMLPLSVLPMRCPGSAAAAGSAAGVAPAAFDAGGSATSCAAAVRGGVDVSAAFNGDTGGCAGGVFRGVPCNTDLHLSRLLLHLLLLVAATHMLVPAAAAGKTRCFKAAHRPRAGLQVQVSLRVEGAGRLAKEGFLGSPTCFNMMWHVHQNALQHCMLYSIRTA
jgi:hypothetical protein